MQKGDSNDELPLVMEEIKAIMGARGTALTLHPDDGGRPAVIYSDEGSGLVYNVVDRLLAEHIAWTGADRPDTHRWVACEVDQSCRDIMLIPVETISGHSRLLISVFFDDLDVARRSLAEQIYSGRKPFAIGYFRLWQLSRTRERELGALRSALNLTEMGVMLIDRSAKLTFANLAAQQMLQDGSALRVRNNTVRAAQLRDSVRLQVALEHVIAANESFSLDGTQDLHAPLLSLERVDRPPLIVSVLPTEKRATEPNDVAAIIYALDPGRDVRDVLKPICKIYHLSPVETRLTCLIVGGLPLAEAATKMRVKEATARSYLKQIFIKTNTHRQAELMQLMLSSIIRTTPSVVPEPMEGSSSPLIDASTHR
ncbi:MAG: hypothetical protein EOP94_00660 [Zymomonas sp.]|nr:MAG: hypothetical protein EOP94_00660 [Zymomonas sp.]